MKLKIIISSIVLVIAIAFGISSFLETNVEYMSFEKAMSTHKKVQVKGVWQKEKETMFDSNKREFSFYMKDDNGMEQKIIYKGARPNNFEIADAIVVKGKYENGVFHASEILTKCPSKYESKPVNEKPNM